MLLLLMVVRLMVLRLLMVALLMVVRLSSSVSHTKKTKVVDSTGIMSPIPPQDLSGNTYPVHGCWAGDGVDFKVLAAAQHPEALRDPTAWAVMLPEALVAVDTLDLAAVATMLARGKLSLAKPWVLVWNDGEGGDDDDDAPPLGRTN
jgi:hypothetical protein